jgi:hypothetical protein
MEMSLFRSSNVSSAGRSLELLNQSDIAEPSQVITQATRITKRVAKLEPECMWRILTEDICHIHRESGVVQDVTLIALFRFIAVEQ